MVQIPKISELYSEILADFQAQLGVTVSPFGRVFIKALVAVQAAKLKLYYLALANVQKNIFADTADPQSMGGTLERFGFIKLGRYPNGATAGQYTVAVTGGAGAVLRASLTFKTDDTSSSPGKLYILDNAYTLTGTADTVTLRALEGGTESKLTNGNTLTATEPIANAEEQVAVTATIIEPANAETVEEYRQKVLNAYQFETTGGSATDYRLWAQDVDNVANTYPFAKSGAPNEVNVFVEATVQSSTDGKGTPSGTMLTDVAAAIEQDPNPPYHGRRPIGVFRVNVLPITVKAVTINISGFVGISSDIQASILIALTSLINGIRPFVDAAELIENKNDILDVNRIVAAILSVQPGAAFGTVTLTVAGTPTASFQFFNGDIPHLNTVTYV
jgi:uncharacterized phage protein gp47/JayE